MNSVFTFFNHTLDKKAGKAIFSYRLQTDQKTYDFSETLIFPTKNIHWSEISDDLLQKALDNLLLILGISYWKTLCPKDITLPTIQLTKQQTEFWNIVYTKGLGEFYYKNQIDYRNLVNFPYTDFVIPSDQGESRDDKLNRSLLFFGGGKDSIVSGELLKENKKSFTLFMTGESGIQKKTAEMMNNNQIIFQRTIDPQLFEMNKQQGIYNGHIPISAVWAFIGIFAAVLYDYQYAITSNEHSANYGNIEYLGQEVNHQWSKSFEFETLFQQYVKENITLDITYFSLLRPLYEIKIAQIFSRYPQYFLFFSSCNRNFKIPHPNPLPMGEGEKVGNGKNWCGECPKCIFVFILLSAFIPKEEVIEIFGKNLLDDPLLLPIVKELLGVEAFKPFECVGTPEEIQLAMYYIYEKEEFQDSIAMQFFVKEILPKLDIRALEKKLLHLKNQDKTPEEFKDVIV